MYKIHKAMKNQKFLDYIPKTFDDFIRLGYTNCEHKDRGQGDGYSAERIFGQIDCF